MTRLMLLVGGGILILASATSVEAGTLSAWGWIDTVPPGDDFVAIACGGGHDLALRQDGSIVA